ncbi:quinolinate synthase NadA [Nitrospira moscoviensis]|uniref:Quinolinate synthase n=1 Tax=Nitrospira moscoviensis TaxID=42253 RepID=A0A0K2G935_NITMO|nr:quinolinate synthase NadA [Nitrospira moscoviensis]ALA57384.1 Quinolinate synthase A [Nitrospira moscoviensis]
MNTVATIPRPIADYQSLSAEELCERTRAAKRALGERVMILGHNYQRDEVIQHADFRGDSLLLAKLAAERSERPYIVFCGVHFMAETADILSRSNQTVILPDMAAGCSMADMAAIEQVDQCWEQLGRVVPVEEAVMPAVYVNSAAVLKAFCGEHGGITCTSSNAKAVIEWCWARREKILFFPDEHLGRNTANKMGVPPDQMIVWDPYQPYGGNGKEAIKRARLILWKGHCSVHQMFQPAHVDHFRKQYPEGKVIVHPECHEDVVNKADLIGSTEFIIRTVTAAPAGTVWAVGTELNLVNRLKQELPDKKVFFLSSTICQCATMFRIDAPHLCWAVENLADGHVVNHIVVPDDEKRWARVALDRMMAIS